MKLRTYILIFLMCLFTILLVACKEEDIPEKIDQNDVLTSIQFKMDEQIKCWNNGDIPCFMEHYWKSDSLLFIGKAGITYGWQATLDNYLESYPDQKNMGQLSFNNKLIRFLDHETVQVIGEWQLTRPELDDLGGHYSLVWKLKDGEWVIISDHSS